MDKPITSMILAIGNAGGNIVEEISRDSKLSEQNNVQYVFADCNDDDLKKREAVGGKIILLDSCSDSFSADVFKDAAKLIIVVGLGGHTGTKFVELAAIAAKEAGVDEINVVVTIPFIFEGDNRLQYAVSATQRLSTISGLKLSVFNNEELMTKYPDLNFFNAFEAVDKEISDIIANLA